MPIPTDEVVIRVATRTATEIVSAIAAATVNAVIEAETITAVVVAVQSPRERLAARLAATEAVGAEAGAGTVKTETHAVIEMGITTVVAVTDDRALAPQADVITALETETTAGPITETVAIGETMIAIAAAVDARLAPIRIPKLPRRSSLRTRGTVARCLCSSLLRG